MKKAVYMCPGCKLFISREVPKVTKTLRSFCATAGKEQIMTLVKNQREALRQQREKIEL